MESLTLELYSTCTDPEGGGGSEAGIISVILQCKFKKFEFFRRGGSGPLAQCKRMTRWGNMCHFPIICIRIYISQRSNFKKKCFRHTKDPIDFSLTKKPPSQKFIENSTFNSLVNSRLIINSYKKGKKRSLTGVYREILISANSSSRCLDPCNININALLSLFELSLKLDEIVCRE